MASSVIILMGPQGSGKGTQAGILSRQHGMVALSSGALLRASRDPEIMRRIDQGLLARSEDVQRVMAEAAESVPEDQGIIIDGFPRMVNEAEWLLEMLAGLGRAIECVILLKVGRDESVRRLVKRSERESRADDGLEKINRRLDLFESETLAVLELWRSKGLLHEVDGLGAVDEVAERINKVLDEAKV